MGWYNSVDVMRARKSHKEKYIQQVSLSVEHIEKIKCHPSTQVVTYPSFKDSFDYVDGLFPEANVKEAVIYKVEKKFLDKCGYKGVGGFYNRIAKVVVIPDVMDFGGDGKKRKLWASVTATITDDEVIVHELLHYASDTQLKCGKSVELEEEFAYGNSVGYLRKKGHSDDFIVRSNFLPYLVNVVDKIKITREILSKEGIDIDSIRTMSIDKQKSLIKKHEKQIFERCIEEAMKMGLEIIDVYTRPQANIENIEVDNGAKKFSMLDI